MKKNIFLIVLISILAYTSSWAQTYTVTSLNYGGIGWPATCGNTTNPFTAGTFLEGLRQANLGNVDRIEFDPTLTGTIDVSPRDVQIILCANNITIVGSPNITISGNPKEWLNVLTIQGSNNVIDGLSVIGRIEVSGASNTITNSTISHWRTDQDAIRITGATANGSIITNNTISSAFNGVLVLGGASMNHLIENNTISNTQNHGIFFDNTAAVTAANSIVRNNRVSQSAFSGIYIKNRASVTVDGNSVTTSATSGGAGIYMQSSNNSIVSNNHVYNNPFNGITLEQGTGLNVSDNIIGLNLAGTAVAANGTNQNMGANQNVASAGIYGVSVANSVFEDNLISGNRGHGIHIFNSPSFGTSRVVGNKIGTDVTGTIPLGNYGQGILIENSNRGFIGEVGKPNIIAANGNRASNSNETSFMAGHGIELRNSSDVTVKANYVGTDISGNTIVGANGQPMGNHLNGIYVNSSSTNTIGGTLEGEGNIVGGNGFAFNDIMTIPDGILGRRHGIQLHATSGNANNNQVVGNSVGLGVNGTSLIGNQQDGLSLLGHWEAARQVSNNTINANTFVDNEFGIFVQSAANNNIITRNFVGTSNGITQMPNRAAGIQIQSGSRQNVVGGQDNPAAGNIIAFNGGSGIIVNGAEQSTALGNANRNRIQSNQIFCNEGKGIELLNNGNINFGANQVIVNTSEDRPGFISGRSPVDAIIQIYLKDEECNTCSSDPSTNTSQGKTYVGRVSTSATSDTYGFIWETNAFAGVNPNNIVVTATDPNGNTSEFSICRPLVQCLPPTNVSVNSTTPVICAGSSATLTATASGLVSGDTYRYTWYHTSVSPANLIESNEGVNTLSVNQAGTYFVVIANTLNEELCSAQNTAGFTVTVTPLPTAPTITGSQSVCFGQTPVTYSVQNPTAGSTYTWTVPTGANILSGQNSSSISVNFSSAAAGAREITVRERTSLATGSCQAAQATVYPVTINALPVITSLTGPTSVCANTENVTYTVVPENAGSTYQWTLPSGVTAVGAIDQSSITVNFGASGSRVIGVRETNASTCTSASVFNTTVTVNALPASPTLAGPTTACANSTATYTVTQQGSNTYTWTVTDATGSVTSGTSNEITFGTSNAIIEVTVTTTQNCSSATPTTRNVTVNARPTTSEITSVIGNEICEATTNAVFSVTNTPGSTYTWTTSLGTIVAGGTSSQITVDFTGATAGVGKVTVLENITATGCTNIEEIEYDFEVFDRPNTDPIQGDDKPLCESQGNVYSVTNTPGSTYTWVVPTGATIVSGQGTSSIIVDFGESNTPAISVTELNEANCTGQTVTFAIELQGCRLKAVISANDDVCENNSILFTDASTGDVDSWTWNFGADASPATASTQGPHTVNYSSPGTKEITLTVTAGLASHDTTFTLEVFEVSTLTADEITGPREICAQTTGVAYEANGMTGSTYAWSATGATLSSISANPTSVSFGNSDAVITLRETTADGCAGQLISIPVTVHPLPDVVTISGGNNICIDGEGTYSVTAQAGATYTWSVDPAATIVGQGTNEITVAYDNSGSYTISVIVETENQCSTPANQVATFNVNVRDLPVIGDITGPKSICSGTNHNYTVDGASSSTFEWQSNIPASTINTGQGTNTINLSVSSAGVGTNALIVFERSEYGCVSAGPAVLPVHVQARPAAPTIVENGFCIKGEDTLATYNMTDIGRVDRFCEGQIARFSVPNIENNDYVWSPNDKIIEGQSTNEILVDLGTADFILSLTQIDASQCEANPATLRVDISKYIDADTILRTFPTLIDESLFGDMTDDGALRVCDNLDTRMAWVFSTNNSISQQTNYNWSVSDNNGQNASGVGINPSNTSSLVNLSFGVETGYYNINTRLVNRHCVCDTVNLTNRVFVEPSQIVDYTVDNPYVCIGDSITYEVVSTPLVPIDDLISVIWGDYKLKIREDTIKFRNNNGNVVVEPFNNAVKTIIINGDSVDVEYVRRDSLQYSYQFVYNPDSIPADRVISRHTYKDVFHGDVLEYVVIPRFCMNTFQSTYAGDFNINVIDRPDANVISIVQGETYEREVRLDYNDNVRDKRTDADSLIEITDRTWFVYPPDTVTSYSWYWISENGQDTLTTDLSNPNDELTTFKVPRQDMVEYWVVTGNGYCKDSTSHLVYIDYIPWAPNAFTPNNDSSFDTWIVKNLDRFPEAQVRIWNRWGSLVYDPGKGVLSPWDGTRNGEALPAGTYFYVVDLGVDGIEPLSGDVSIVK